MRTEDSVEYCNCHGASTIDSLSIAQSVIQNNRIGGPTNETCLNVRMAALAGHSRPTFSLLASHGVQRLVYRVVP